MPPDRRRLIHGRLGEWAAAAWLQLRGWRIVARRRRLAGVEVDLIARRGSVDALVEVKWRRRRTDGLPLAWLVGHAQQARLRRAARAWASRKSRGITRIDVVEVCLQPLRLRHHEDAVR